MGRPLNSKYFGDAATKLQVECYTERAGASTAGHIIRQRSNLIYEIGDETLTDVDVDNLVIGSLYEIVVPGTTGWVAAGAPDAVAGTRFYAATAASDGTGTAREIVFGTLQEAAVTAAGQARLLVTPDNSQATVQATVTFTAAGGTGALQTVTIANAGYGYWTDETNVDIGGTSDGTIDYTVANGSLATVSINTAGAANTDATVDIADAPATNPPTQYARIINAKQVKCFPVEGGNTFAWPIVGTNDGPGPSGLAEADLAEQS